MKNRIPEVKQRALRREIGLIYQGGKNANIEGAAMMNFVFRNAFVFASFTCPNATVSDVYQIIRKEWKAIQEADHA